MDPATTSIFGAFLVGLGHTFQPCEDKAIVAAFVAWSTRRFIDALPLVVFYGLGITLVNTILGFAFAYAGSALLEDYETQLKVVAGAVTILFGLYMFSKFSHLHLGEHGEAVARGNPNPPSVLGMFAFGMTRGVALCPVELAILTWALSTASVVRGTLMLFVFGLGTTIGLIPVALVMGGIAGALQKTRYGSWIPRVAPTLMVAIGVLLILSPFIGIEI